MLQVRVLGLGSTCLETSTKDQCEQHSFRTRGHHCQKQVTEEEEKRVDFRKPELME